MFKKNDIIMITDEKENIFNLKGEVVGHNHITDEVAYRIIAHNYRGIATYVTKAKNCTLVERGGIRQYLNDK